MWKNHGNFFLMKSNWKGERENRLPPSWSSAPWFPAPRALRDTYARNRDRYLRRSGSLPWRRRSLPWARDYCSCWSCNPGRSSRSNSAWTRPSCRTVWCCAAGARFPQAPISRSSTRRSNCSPSSRGSSRPPPFRPAQRSPPPSSRWTTSRSRMSRAVPGPFASVPSYQLSPWISLLLQGSLKAKERRRSVSILPSSKDFASHGVFLEIRSFGEFGNLNSRREEKNLVKCGDRWIEGLRDNAFGVKRGIWYFYLVFDRYRWIIW